MLPTVSDREGVTTKDVPEDTATFDIGDLWVDLGGSD